MANDAYPSLNQRYFDHENGFPHMSVYDITEDKDGFIWFGTQLGLVKFDGYTFTTYQQNNDPSLGPSSNFVYDLELDKDKGVLWLATAAGLTQIEPKSGKFKHVKLVNGQNTEDKIINSIHQNPDGIIWVGTDQGLYKQLSNTHFELQYNLNNDSINDIISLDPDRLLLATSAGIAVFNIVDAAIEASFLPEIPFLTFMLDGEGSVWAGSNGSGLYHFKALNNNNPQIRQLTTNDGLPDNVINDLALSNKGEVWIATTDGVSIFPTAEFTTFVNYQHKGTDGKTSNVNLLSLFINSNGFIFLGSQNEGFSILDPNTTLFSSLTVGEDPLSYSVSAGNDNSIWVASDSGVYNVDSELNTSGPFFSTQNENDSLKNKVTYVHFSNTTGTLWAGSRTGLSELDPRRGLFERVGFENQRVYTINEDLQGNLWIGTSKNGVYQFDPKNREIVNHWSMPQVFRILPISANEVWVATVSGLYLINPSSKKSLVFTANEQDPESLPFDSVTWISHIKNNQFVIGTQSKGVATMQYDSVLQKPIFTPVLNDSIVSNLSIGAIVEDQNNNFWITTIKGLARANEDFTQVDYFDKTNGAHSNGYFIGSQAAIYPRLYFSGPSGITYFNPNEIQKNPLPPLVRFTDVATLFENQSELMPVNMDLLYKGGTDKAQLTVEPNNLVLRVGFAALEFGAPDNIKYQYKLEGFHQTWQKNENNARSVTFTNLNAGTYILKIRISNRYGEWIEKYETLTIEVLAPWWETKIAKFVFFCLILLFLFFIYQWRTFKLKNNAKLLSKMVNDKTKDLELAKQKLEKLINLDPLTEVYNRRGFMDYGCKEFAKFKRNSTSFTILLIDIDHFKKINDKYGHDVGDRSLVVATKTLKDNLRTSDILARWGGEEFIVLLPSTDTQQGMLVGEKLRAAIEHSKVDIDQHILTFTVSGGVCEITTETTLEECIKLADTYLYDAKKQGRNRIITGNTA